MVKSRTAAMPGALLLACLSAGSPKALAHGFAGERFFPPTITTDDPAAADELAFPTISSIVNPAGDGDPTSHELDVGFEFDKLILPHLSLGIADTYSWVQPKGQPRAEGWQNLTLNAKYELVVDGPHEFMLSVGVEADVGGTGSKSIGRDSFTTFSPTLYFGKGLGDLPPSLKFLRPIAVTGTLAQSFPTRAQAPNTFDWGLSLQYQLPYLQQHVMDIGLPHPFRDMIPLVEIAGSTTENRGASVTTATVNPGILYETKYCQLGIEALIPVNADSGPHVGVVFQVWWFLDDLAPKFFGQPLFFGDNP